MELCLSLDLPEAGKNISLAKSLKDFDIWLKVGFRSYIRDGRALLEELKNINENFKIFLDLKLYDIPNTMADAAQEIADLNVDMFNVHASSGKVAMQAVMQRLENQKNHPLVLAVTALTSFDNDNFKNIYNEDIQAKAVRFAKDSYESGLNGVVCSAYESKNIKKNTNDNFLTLTPGIRPYGEESGDQKRVADLKKAKEEMVDFIVIGRPICQSKDPKALVEKILSDI